MRWLVLWLDTNLLLLRGRRRAVLRRSVHVRPLLLQNGPQAEGSVGGGGGAGAGAGDGRSRHGATLTCYAVDI